MSSILVAYASTGGSTREVAEFVAETLRAAGQAEIPADDVGLAILAPLRELDPVVYLRFASVYKHYASVEDFESEIKNLRGTEPAPV